MEPQQGDMLWQTQRAPGMRNCQAFSLDYVKEQLQMSLPVHGQREQDAKVFTAVCLAEHCV